MTKTKRALLVIGACWLACVWGVALLSARVWPDHTAPASWSYDVARRASPLARWDSGWYIGIAESGYGPPPKHQLHTTNHAFFPLYPFLVRLVARTTRLETSVAGSLVSAAALLGSLLLLGSWVERRYGEGRVVPTALVLLLFPTAFFFAAVYTEALLLFLALACIVALENGRFRSGLLAGYLSGMTRISGVVLAPYAAMVAWEEGRSRPRDEALGRAAAAALAPVAGFATFCLYFWRRFDDPFLFIRAQHNWGEDTKTILDGPLLIWQTLVRDFGAGQLLRARTQEGIYIVLFLALALVFLFRRKVAEAVFVGSTAFIVLLTGTLESAGRYVLPAFPAFALLAALSERKLAWRLLLAAFALAQAAHVFAFVHSLWVG